MAACLSCNLLGVFSAVVHTVGEDYDTTSAQRLHRISWLLAEGPFLSHGVKLNYERVTVRHLHEASVAIVQMNEHLRLGGGAFKTFCGGLH